jgi:arabinofuranosyltransferase
MVRELGKGALIQRWTVRFFWVLLLLQIFKYAWLTEDAFINFRVVDHLLAGDGPVWNVGERVQVFTSPLWLMLTAGGAYLAGGVMGATLWASACLVLVFFALVFRTSGDRTLLFLLVAMACVLSPSMRDYFTSGLETPLLMAALAWFFATAVRRAEVSWRWLCFVASVCLLVRHDTALLVAPFLLQRFLQLNCLCSAHLLRKALSDALLGGLPFLSWTLFAIVYYGSPVPNTAAAKLVPGFDGPAQAWHYFVFMQGFDPFAYPLICLAVVVNVTTRSPQAWPMVAALSLFVLYLCHVGADYMAGRFLIGPLSMSALLLVHATREVLARTPVDWPLWAKNAVLMTTVAMLGFQVLLMPNASAHKPPRPPFVHGVTDERHHYHGSTDLMTLLTEGPQHRYLESARLIAANGGQPLYIACNVGMLGYYSPTDAHIVDPLALADRFLSGMPVRPGPLRIGHFERLLPSDYVASLTLSRNEFTDPLLRRYFDDVQSVVVGPLFAAPRWSAIWRLNTGQYRPSLAALTLRSGGGALRMTPLPTQVGEAPLSCLGSGGGVMVPEQQDGVWTLRMLTSGGRPSLSDQPVKPVAVGPR